MTQREYARLSGLVYLLAVLTGMFALMYVPSQIPIVWENAPVTVSNILKQEFLCRLGILSEILCYIFFLILPIILYRLLEPENRNIALIMAVLAISSVPFSLFNVLNKIDALTLLSGAQYLNAFVQEQIYAQVLLLLKSYSNGIQVIQILWGLWLFPFGYLVYKSNLLPKVFGLLLMTGCFGYLIKFFGSLLFPETEIPGFVRIPASLGEIGTCLWLLLMGVRAQEIETNSNKEIVEH
ncbi:DUF4386 domain-containing protein [Microbulbifer sp. THAF38]|uniref:DUF4386 domain-containing protein n=1 Tax=Microbulbifer sp. THAF38 TaxID=2587856 RepID=UPI001268973F|nr:DUF4386 domain-containing protein [Microbulbifer sp. THAF38]QFT56743.1 hypothetical protein FIU95_19515 [Microbulbifer sp. THAF38]